jgi:tetratricopeptide (TPR) repeat protein
MKFRNLALATAGMLFLAFTSLAQITALEGDVKGEDGKPLVGAVIKIVRTDIKGNYTVKTDKKGHFFYNGLPIGFYNVSVEVDGKEADGRNGVKTSLGGIPPLVFDLQARTRERASMQAAAEKAAQTGQLTKEMERGLTPDQKAALEKQLKEREGAMKKNKELNDAFNAGFTALQAKQYDEAITSLTKAGEIGADQPAVWTNLAEAYLGLAATKSGAEFDAAAQKGTDAYAKAIALKPDDAGVHNNYALALVKAKKVPEAQAELTKAAQLDPANAGKYYYNLGAVLTNIGQSDAAGEVFKKAIELDPKHADSYYQYGLYLVGKASFAADGKVTPVPGTVEALQKYLELQPNGPFAQPAKDMLTTLSATVDTSYKNPNAPPEKKKKK